MIGVTGSNINVDNVGLALQEVTYMLTMYHCHYRK